MKQVLILRTDKETLSLVKDGNIAAWFYGDVLHESAKLKRAATLEEFNYCKGNPKYTSLFTELNIPMPSPWKVVALVGEKMRVMRTFGKQIFWADFMPKPGKESLTTVVKNIDNGILKEIPKCDFTWLKYPDTVLEMMPGFNKLKCA